MTHAFFKAVLFLGAGSVIIALHHEQDMRSMGGLRKYMPITYATMLIGALRQRRHSRRSPASSPRTSIIEAVHASQLPGAGFAYFCDARSACSSTAFYSFRLIFYDVPRQGALQRSARSRRAGGGARERPRHGAREQAHDAHAHDEHARTTHGDPTATATRRTSRRAVVTLPLILLAIPSICAGWVIGTCPLRRLFRQRDLSSRRSTTCMAELAAEFHGVVAMMLHALTTPAVLARARRHRDAPGTSTSCGPDLPRVLRAKAGLLVYRSSMEKYGFDALQRLVLRRRRARCVGTGLWKGGDVGVIDGVLVNGSARAVGWFAQVIRRLQSGYIYHYAFAMIIGILVLLTLMVFVWL